MLLFGAQARFERTIVAFNECVSIGVGGGEVDLSCVDLFGNTGGDWVEEIADQYGVEGNFSLDPLFCGPTEGDFTLRADSPCLPGNHPNGDDCRLIGALDEGCSPPTPVLTTTWGALRAGYR
ncbi:MAG: hypothetical protein GF346_01270 [Candidatus Eisenbacteria bacterium]|nr:hypothetical protein [Candidatus Latescibacterota bacterium]MBD3301060.1 hypothetical protein [Candidatus Eisenbacteria bacterium]